MLCGALVSEELENAVRAVLANLDGLYPFTTQHFNIFPYKSKWEQVSKMKFMKEGVKLSPYPFLITLYVEYREPVFPYAAMKNATTWNAPSILKSPQCASEPARTDRTTAMHHPEEGTMIQHQDDEQTPECLQESPSSANGAEEMVCGSEIHADSPVTCLQAPDAHDVAPGRPDPRQNTGIITRMASSLFPFSLFYRKSPAT
ncbi:membrane-anchored junction protein [Puntigrus tetrazona]|uniref:membrane-anchored junction protein n=1 Tax=Puntigrus tetrazona TaxID=1606681 RepID=UPI001C8AA762|nr:membrane-anchored junction protein [Puntigrus tetrazona]